MKAQSGVQSKIRWKIIVGLGLSGLGLSVCTLFGLHTWYSVANCSIQNPITSGSIALPEHPINTETVDDLVLLGAINGLERMEAEFSPDDSILVSLGRAYSNWGRDPYAEQPSHCSVTWIVDMSGAHETHVRVNNSGIETDWLWGAPRVSFNSEGNQIALNNVQKQIISIPSGDELARLTWERPPFFGDQVVFSSDDRWIVTSADSRILVGDTTTFALRYTLEGDTEHITGLDFSHTLVSASDDGTIRSWDLNTGESTILHRWNAQPNIRLTVASNGNIAISGSDYGIIINAVSGTEVMQVERGWIEFSPNGRYITSSRNHWKRVWDVETQRLMGVIRTDTDSRITPTAFDPTSEIIALASSQRMLNIYSITGELLSSYHAVPEGEITDIEFSHSGTLLAISWASDDRQRGGIQFWGVR